MTKELVHPDWVRRFNLFGDIVGDPRLLAGLDPDELLATARAVDRVSTISARPSGRAGPTRIDRMVTAIDDGVAAARARSRRRPGPRC